MCVVVIFILSRLKYIVWRSNDEMSVPGHEVQGFLVTRRAWMLYCLFEAFGSPSVFYQGAVSIKMFPTSGT